MAKLEEALKVLQDYHYGVIDEINNIKGKLWSTDGYNSYGELLESLSTQEQNEAFSELYKDDKKSSTESLVSSQVAQRVQISTICAIRRGYRMKMVSGADNNEYSRANLRRKELVNRHVAIGKLTRLVNNRSVNIEENISSGGE